MLEAGETRVEWSFQKEHSTIIDNAGEIAEEEEREGNEGKRADLEREPTIHGGTIGSMFTVILSTGTTSNVAGLNVFIWLTSNLLVEKGELLVP